MGRKELEELVRSIWVGKDVASSVQSITKYGKEALEYILDARQGYGDSLPKGRDPRDAFSDIQEAVFNIAKLHKADYLARLSTSMENDSDDLFTLTWIAGPLQFDEVIDNLIIGLKHKNKLIRWSCSYSLGYYHNDKIIYPLIDALRDRAVDVRSTALDGLAKYNDRRAKANLTKLLNDRYPGIRERAKELLTKLD